MRATRIAKFLVRAAAQSQPQSLRMALSPEYSLVNSSGRVALSRDLAGEAMSKFEKNIPFNNLFGKGVTRVVVPMINSMKASIMEAIGKKGSLKEQGYDSIDWQAGEAIKTTLPGPGAPADAQPKIRRDKIGKVLGRMPEEKDLLKWWSDNSEAAKTDDYSIVVSRHPVDVLRMSDHKTWKNCHTPGGMHFTSCFEEMKHGGLVAYLVNTEHLAQLSPEQISGKGEIFKDADRDVDGIKPVSRLRLRRYTRSDGSFDLAIPEMKVYGQGSAEFLNQVTNWSRKVQRPVLEGKRWRSKEFVRRGGQYVDSGYDDATWFDNFFEDNLERYGNTQYGVEGKEGIDLGIVQRAEMEEMHARWQQEYEHCYTSYEEFDDPDDDGNLRFSWYGGIKIEIPMDMFASPAALNSIDWDELNSASDSLREYLGEHNVYMGDEEISFRYGAGSARFAIGVSDHDAGHGGPEEYGDFCDSLYEEWENSYESIREHVLAWLRENDYLIPTPMRKFKQADVRFQNFEASYDEDGMYAEAEAPIGKWDLELLNKAQVLHSLITGIRGLVAKEIQKVVQNQRDPVGYLPWFGPETTVTNKNLDLDNFIVELRESFDKPPTANLHIAFMATDVTTEKEMQDVIDLMTVVDRMFPRIVAECTELLTAYYNQKRTYYRKYYTHNPEDKSFQGEPFKEKPTLGNDPINWR